MCQGLRLKGQGDGKEEPGREMLHKLKTDTFLSPLNPESPPRNQRDGQTQSFPFQDQPPGEKPWRAMALGALTGLWRFTGSRPREDPCRLWQGRHSNRESHASPAISSRGHCSKAKAS